jgi:hypothetical protein
MFKSKLMRGVSGLVIASILAPSISMASVVSDSAEKRNEIIQAVNEKMNKKFNAMSPERQMRVLKNTQYKLQKLENNLITMSAEEFSKKEEKIKTKIASLAGTPDASLEQGSSDNLAALNDSDTQMSQDFSELSSEVNTEQLTNELGAVDTSSMHLDRSQVIQFVHDSKASLEKEIQDRGGKFRNPASANKFLNWAVPIALLTVFAVTGQLFIFLALAAMGTVVFFAMIGVIELISYVRRH